MKEGKLFYAYTKKSARKILSLILLSSIAALFIGIAMSLGLVFCQEIVFWGFLSFAATGLILGVLSTVMGIINLFAMKKRHPNLWKKGENRNSSALSRFDAQIRLDRVKDPYLKKISNIGTLLGFLFLALWLSIFLVVIIGALVFKNQTLMNFLSIFK